MTRNKRIAVDLHNFVATNDFICSLYKWWRQQLPLPKNMGVGRIFSRGSTI